MTDDDLKKLIAEATPGPWEFGNDAAVRTTDAEHAETIVYCYEEADGRLLAAAPSLAAEVLMLRGLVRRMAERMSIGGVHQSGTCASTRITGDGVCDCGAADDLATFRALLSEARKAAT